MLPEPRLHDQFLLSQRELVAPEWFTLHRFGPWHLYTGERLPVIPVLDGATQVGWLLGWAVTPEGVLLGNEHPLQLSTADPEPTLAGLAGRWVCLLLAERPRVYLDVGASLGVVYEPAVRVLGSTTTLVRKATGRELDAPPPALVPNQFYPAGRTHDPLVSRLMPNHALELDEWRPRRHWPEGPLVQGTMADVPREIETILDEMRRLIVTLASAAPLLLPLSGGRDSRMILAAARPVAYESEYVTFRYADYRRLDALVARHVAKVLGLKRHELGLRSPTAEERALYLEAIGHDASAGKARDFFVAARELSSDYGLLTGFGGGMGREIYAPKGARTDARELLGHSLAPATPANIAAVEDWLANAPAGTREDILHLYFLEVRQGGWASPQFYGYAPFAFTLVPFMTRRSIEAMFRLPVDYRRAQTMVTDLIRAGWPELLEIPIARRPGPVGVLDKAYLRLRHRVHNVLH